LSEALHLGHKIRSLRRREGLTQKKLAEKLDISASYLNLIEHDKRPVTAALLLKLASTFDLDLTTLSADDDADLVRDLMEAFGDPMFESTDLTNMEVREVVRQSGSFARAVVKLYSAYRDARQSAEQLASRVLATDELADNPQLPSEEVTALIQHHRNHFPELEAGAEHLWKEGRFDPNNVYDGMVRYLEEELWVKVRVVMSSAARGAVRRYDPRRNVLQISEVLAPRSRNFQIAHQIGLLTQGDAIDRYASDPILTTDESRKLARMVLANYFAGCMLMPYARFHQAARQERYDIELLGHRFRASFEQICHRLTTLQRPGAEGVPFHLVKIDTAGNISKRFSASGIRFSRYGGACPRWNVSNAFLKPNEIRIQISRMPGGDAYFCMARTLMRRHGGYRSPETVYAIGLGCSLEQARHLVYADGIDLEQVEHRIVPIGMTCRLCERPDCDQRAFPSLRTAVRLDENVRGVGFYTQVRRD